MTFSFESLFLHFSLMVMWGRKGFILELQMLFSRSRETEESEHVLSSSQARSSAKTLVVV